MLKVESPELTIARTLDECVIYWGAYGIPHEQIEEMKHELELHLREAIRDGKTVESIVGGHSVPFAEAWAAQNRPQRSSRSKALEWFGYLAGCYGFFLCIPGHVLNWSLSFPIDGQWLAAIFVPPLVAGMVLVPGISPAKYEGPTWMQALIYSGIGALALTILFGINLAVHLGSLTAFSTWTWPATLAVMALGVLGWTLPRRRTEVRDLLVPEEELRILRERD